MDTFTAIALATLGAGTPLVFAALGELITEKSGVLNLGVEGMMLAGAVCGFAVAADTGNDLAADVGQTDGAKDATRDASKDAAQDVQADAPAAVQ